MSLSSKYVDGNLLVVSNAPPYVIDEEGNREKKVGGLTSALDPMMQKVGGTWLAGERQSGLEHADSEGKLKVPDEDGYTLKYQELTPEERERFYLNYSNRVIWPWAHGMPNRVSKSAQRGPENWEAYERVNGKYGKSAREELQEGDLLWAHDYHLTRMKETMGADSPEASSSLFWHINWPNFNYFRGIPEHKEIMKGLLQYDHLGLHLDDYRENFFECVEELGGTVDREKNLVKGAGSEIRVGAFPLGIDFDFFSSLSDKKEVKEKTQEWRDKTPADDILVSVDRADYIKGIPPKIRGIYNFFDENPEFREKVTLFQKLGPPRNAKEYKDEKWIIDNLIEGINEEYGTDDWKPVEPVHEYLDMDELVSLYRAADSVVVTSRNDGLNLVVKEAIASGADTAILSEDAGAHKQLGSDAYSVKVMDNPTSEKDISEAIKEFIYENQRERKSRHHRMRRKVEEENLESWEEEYLDHWLEEV